MEQLIPFLITFGAALFLGLVLLMASTFLGPKYPNKSKAQPFESGWIDRPKISGHYVAFYLIGVLFLTFDLELVLLYPWVTIFKTLGLSGLITIFIFLGILGIGLVYIWKKGVFQWN